MAGEEVVALLAASGFVALLFVVASAARRAPRPRRPSWRPSEEADRRAVRKFRSVRSSKGLTLQEWHDGRAVPTRRGELVRSLPEARVADWLFAHGVTYEYEAEVCGFRPDFYLPDANVVVEYWGSREARYDQRRRLKTAVYLRKGYQLVSLEAGKPVSLEEDLRRQLWHKGIRPERATRTRS